LLRAHQSAFGIDPYLNWIDLRQSCMEAVRPRCGMIENNRKYRHFPAIRAGVPAARTRIALDGKPCLPRRFGHTLRATGRGNDRGQQIKTYWGETS
jgi:hypothetical protein